MDTSKPAALLQETESLLDVLIIDDETAAAEACRQTLEDEGYRVAVAGDRQQGLHMAQSDSPSVVLLGFRIPGVTGFEALSRIAGSESPAVPIVMAGNGTVDAAVESMRLGAHDFLTKPVDPEKLLESVRSGISLSTLRRQANAPKGKQDLLLQGLGFLGEAYSMGLEKRQLLDELKHLENEAKHYAENLGRNRNKERTILSIREDLLEADAIMRDYGFRKNALIQILLDVQEKFHWLPRHILSWISGRLNIPLREIYIIANFYEAFSLEPRGRHSFQVCTGTACHVRGASELLARVSAALDLQPGQTDSNLTYTLETVHCLGCCALAPVIQIDSEYYRDPDRSKLDKIIKTMQKEETHA
ncbi:MAG: NAD(P)H-dependent oxidoreductase subunit E [Acidobacteriota bacterium]|nr:NAD(P)H-dependent oxidoreductase subunit E [Acidobacteriota bacterium]